MTASSSRQDLKKALEIIKDQGFFFVHGLNLRTDQEGYNWGPSTRYSRILQRFGINNPELGSIESTETLAEIGLNAESKIAERWFVTDDLRYPSITYQRIQNRRVAVPLHELLAAYPEGCLGKAHVKAFGPALGMLMKYLDVAHALSWQVHIGLTEGYVVEYANPEMTGIFAGVRQLKNQKAQQQLIKKISTELKNLKSPLVRWPHDGVETRVKNMPELKKKLLQIKENWSAPQLVVYLLVEGMNIIDLTALHPYEDFKSTKGLLQGISLQQGQRFTTQESRPHAFFALDEEHSLFLIEFKATTAGIGLKRRASSEQTWSLADNFLGKEPRPGKVTAVKLKEALEAVRKEKKWGEVSGKDFAHHGDEKVKTLSRGVKSLLLHFEPQYAARQIFLKEGARVRLNRFGQHSALTVREGQIRIRTVKGKKLLDLKREEEVFILANQGDLIFEAIGSKNAELIEFKRPVPKHPYPEPVIV